MKKEGHEYVRLTHYEYKLANTTQEIETNPSMKLKSVAIFVASTVILYIAVTYGDMLFK